MKSGCATKTGHFSPLSALGFFLLLGRATMFRFRPRCGSRSWSGCRLMLRGGPRFGLRVGGRLALELWCPAIRASWCFCWLRIHRFCGRTSGLVRSARGRRRGAFCCRGVGMCGSSRSSLTFILRGSRLACHDPVAGKLSRLGRCGDCRIAMIH